MAKIIRADGSQGEITGELKGGRHELSLAQVQKVVGGYVEVLRLQGGSLMLVNEEGALRGLPRNELASAYTGQTIVGDVIVCERREFT